MKIYNNKLYNLPEDIIDLIFEYENPYKIKYEKVLFDLKYFILWFNTANFFSPKINKNFYIYILKSIKILLEKKKLIINNKY